MNKFTWQYALNSEQLDSMLWTGIWIDLTTVLKKNCAQSCFDACIAKKNRCMLYFDVNPPVANTVIDKFNSINVCEKSKTE